MSPRKTVIVSASRVPNCADPSWWNLIQRTDSLLRISFIPTIVRRGITSQPSSEGKRVGESLKGMVTATPFDVCLRG